MNINPEAKRILIFGDSLSWGYIPASKHLRYPADVRWPGKLQEILGNGFEIVEEALNSRGIEFGDPRPGKEGRRSLDYIEACLDSHDPIDLVIVLLGTNELKNENNQTAQDVSLSMEKLLKIIVNRPSQFRVAKPAVLLISPPVVNENTDYCKTEDKYLGATEKSKELSFVYRELANNLGIDFLSLADIVETGDDGVHIDESAHNKVAESVAKIILA